MSTPVLILKDRETFVADLLDFLQRQAVDHLPQRPHYGRCNFSTPGPKAQKKKPHSDGVSLAQLRRAKEAFVGSARRGGFA
jgi:hypothetical protein